MNSLPETGSNRPGNSPSPGASSSKRKRNYKNSWLYAKRIPIGVTFLLLLFSIRLLSSSVQKSVTIDEFVNLPAGYALLEEDDLRLCVAAPILAYNIFALTAPFQDIKLTLSRAWNEDRRWEFAYDFMQQNRDNYQRIFILARMTIVLLSILLGYSVFLWSKELYGPRNGLLALFFYSFSPNILAHSRLLTSDLPVTCAIFIALYFFWKSTREERGIYIFLAGVTLGLAQLIKFTALILYPVYLLIALLNLLYILIKVKPHHLYRSTKRFTAGLAAIILISLIVINIGYGFKDSFLPLKRYDFKSDLLKPLNQENLDWIPVPLPSHYVNVFDRAEIVSRLPFPSYLAGEISSRGWWYYYLIALSLKVPIPLIIFTAVAVIFLIWMKIESPFSPSLCFLLLPSAIIMLAVSLKSVNIGLRYILPVFPLMMVLASSVIDKRLIGKTPLRIVFAALTVWYLVSSLSLHPHYLAYFNEIAGGPANGYRYLIDSNLDWGQDLIGLKRYMDKNRIPKIHLAYFGRVDPAIYGISYEPLISHPSRSPVSGYIAISATLLQGRPYFLLIDGKYLWTPDHLYDWLREHKPIARIGHSIFIYHLA